MHQHFLILFILNVISYFLFYFAEIKLKRFGDFNQVLHKQLVEFPFEILGKFESCYSLYNTTIHKFFFWDWVARQIIFVTAHLFVCLCGSSSSFPNFFFFLLEFISILRRDFQLRGFVFFRKKNCSKLIGFLFLVAMFTTFSHRSYIFLPIPIINNERVGSLRF